MPQTYNALAPVGKSISFKNNINTTYVYPQPNQYMPSVGLQWPLYYT